LGRRGTGRGPDSLRGATKKGEAGERAQDFFQRTVCPTPPDKGQEVIAQKKKLEKRKTFFRPEKCKKAPSPGHGWRKGGDGHEIVIESKKVRD